MNVLVVGSTGFVGQNFIEFLEKNPDYQFTSLDRKLSKQKHKQCTWNDLGIIDLVSFDVIFYFTGKAHDVKNTSDDSAYFEINVGLLERFLKASQEADFQGKFVFLSSVKAVADVVNGILDEDTTPDPKTAYGKSKLEAEQLILNSYLAKNAFILRPCMIHGKGNKGNLNLLHQFVSKGIPNILASYDNERSLLNIDNLIFVFEKIIQNRLKSGVYQVSDEGVISTSGIMRVISKTLNKKPLEIKVPKFLIKTIAKIGDVLPLPINSERLQKLTENYRVSNKKLVQNLGQPLPVDLERGLENTLKTF
jgi:nucleoside-diphosphate-sugar epimerase